MFRGKNSRRSPYSHKQLPARAGHHPKPHPVGHHPRPAGHHHQAQRVLPGPVRPHYNPHHTRPSEVRENAEETIYQDRICTLCSDKHHDVSHHHVSSESVRVFAKNHMKKFLYSCIMCKMDESVVRPTMFLDFVWIFSFGAGNDFDKAEQFYSQCTLASCSSYLVQLYSPSPGLPQKGSIFLSL